MAKTKVDKDDIKRLVENTSNPSSTTSVYSAKYVDDNFLKEITKEAIEAKLTGVITSHDHNYTTSTDVQTLINTAVASVYKPKGNIADKTALLALTNVKQGDVYNAQSPFTLINGQNVQNIKIGDNIVCLSDAATSVDANWDNLSGNIDYGDLGDMPVATDTEVGGIKLLFTPGNSGIIPIQLVESKAYIELLADNIRYAIGNDTVINGKKYWLKNKTIIIPDGNVGVPSEYSEGLRIANSPNGYSLIALGAGDNTTSGLNSDGNQWNIIKHPDGELTISFDSGFDDGNRTGRTLYKNGDIYWKNARLNLPRVSPFISGWLHYNDFTNFNRVADHAQITLTSKELLSDDKQTNIGGDEIFGNDSPEFDNSGLYDGSGSYNLVEGRRYEVIINMGMHSSMDGVITLNLVTGGVVIKSTSTTANEGYLSMSLSCIVDGGNSISVSIQKDASIELILKQNQCWFAVHEIK